MTNMTPNKQTMRPIRYANLAEQHRALIPELLNAAERVIRSGQFILGDDVSTFESELAARLDCKFAVGVNSGTDALFLAMKALGIGAGDEVITVPNSYIATTSSIVMTGATPVFVDVDDSFNLNPKLLAGVLTERTRAIVPVHLTGRPADMPRICAFAQQHGLLVVEDSAQAIGAHIDGKYVGTFGDAGCYSLHPLKTLNACGDGGVIVTNSEELDETLRRLRNLGHSSRDCVVDWGINSRLDTIQAAFLRVKMAYVDGWITRRRENASYYRRNLHAIRQLSIPQDAPETYCVYHTFIVQAEKRDDLRDYLERHDVRTAVHYPIPIHLQDVAAQLGYRRGDMPVAEAQAQRIVSLPIYPELTHDELGYIVAKIKGFYED